MEITPVSLLLRLRHMPRPADWNRFVDLCTPLLLKWAKSVGLSDSAAADLSQDVFVVLIREMPQFEYDPNRSFRKWLKTVTLNRWRTDNRRTKPVSLDGPNEVQDGLLTDDPNESFWEKEFARELVGRAMEISQNRFESKSWEAFRLMATEGYSAQQTADALGITVAAAFKAKSRILKTLRDELQGLFD